MELLAYVYLWLVGVVVVYMGCWFMLAIIKKRNDVADVAWGLGFLLIAVLTWYSGGSELDRSALATMLVAVWALRLSIHIYLRNRHKTEDKRYEAWRKEWGNSFYIRTFLQVFMLQGGLMLLVVSPVVIINTFYGSPFNWLDIVGVCVWAVGFFFESVGDAQLTAFIKDPANRGRVMKGGLWKYTRHPNYFGEVTQWWGLWIIALSTPYGWLGIIGPLTITILILKVSGIPLLEKSMQGNPEFEEYKKHTSVFFPLPPK